MSDRPGRRASGGLINGLIDVAVVVLMAVAAFQDRWATFFGLAALFGLLLLLDIRAELRRIGGRRDV